MSIEVRTVAWTALVFKQVMKLADALWFITYWWHETVTTLHSHSPAPKPYAYKEAPNHMLLSQRPGVYEPWQESLLGERKLKNNETNHTAMKYGVYMYIQQWPGMVISALAKKIRPAWKEGRKVGPRFACVCVYINNSDICSIYGTKHHTYVKYQAWGSGLDGIHKIIMLIVNIYNYWGKSLFI